MNRKKVNNSVLVRIADGDESAVKQCLDDFGGIVWTLAKQMCRDQSEAEDATQEIFLELWKNAGRYDPLIGSEATFVAMIARRRLIDRFRRNNNSLELIDNLEQIDVEGPGDLDQLELADEVAKAANCMTRLTKQQQTVLMLSIQQGISHSHISKKIGIPLGSVKSLARRALIQLRDCMKRRILQSNGGVL